MADSNFATLVSATTAANAIANPIFVRLTDGTDASLIDGSGNLNAILASNSGVDIGDVDVLSVPAPLNVTGGGTEAAALRVTIANDSTGLLSVDDGGSTLSIDDGGGSITVDGTVSVTGGAIDDAAFTPAVDGVTVLGGFADETAPDSVDEGDQGALRMTLDRKLLVRMVGATDANRADVDGSGNVKAILAANSGVDIGDVDVTSVPAPLSTSGGGTEAAALRVTIASDSTGLVSIDDNGGSITVDGTVGISGTVTVTATDLDIRDLTSVSDSVSVLQATHDSLNANANIQVSDTDVSASNPVPVTIVDPGASSTEVNDYDTQAALAGAASDNHDYTVTGTTFLLRSVIFAASGALKAEIQAGPVASLVTKAVGFIPKTGGVIQLDFNPPIEVPVTSTGTVRIIRTNREGASQDVYSTIIGNDV